MRVRRGRSGRRPSRAGRARTGSCSAVPGQRRAGLLEAADRRLLVAERGAVPRLDQHPDPPRDEVAAAAEPPLRLVVADPDVAAHRVGVVAVDVVRAVLEALEVARRLLARGRRRGAAEAELRPAQRRPRRGRSGRGCARRGRRPAGRSAQAWTQRSPPERSGSSESPGSGPSGRSRDGPARPEAERAVREERRPEPERDRQPRRREPERLAGVGRRRELVPVDRAGRQPRGHRRRRAVHERSRSRSSDRLAPVRSNAPKTSRSCAGGRDPGLVLAVERDDPVRGRRAVVAARRARPPRRRPRARPRRPPAATRKRRRSSISR